MKVKYLTTILAIIILLVVTLLVSELFKAHAWYNPCKWQCPISTASPTASPTEEPSPTPVEINPCEDGLKVEWQEETPCPSPTASPSETPVPTETPSPSDTPSESPTPTAVPTEQPSQDVYIPQPGVPVAPACDKIQFAPTVLSFKRNNPMSVHITWSKVDSFVTDYKIEYGLSPDVWLWNTIVTGNETDLNFLPPGHMIWVRVAGTENGCVGNFSEPLDP